MSELTGLGSQVTSTDIASNVYHYRPINTHNTGHQCLLRRHNGDLWALVTEPGGFLIVYISFDNGFSWVRMGADPSTTLDLNIGTFTTDGPFQHMVVSERWNEVQFLFPDDNITVIQGVSIPFEDFLQENYESATFTTTNFTAVNTGLATENYFRLANHKNQSFLWYVNSSDRPTFRKLSPRANALSSASAITVSPVEPIFGVNVMLDSKVDLLYVITDTTKRVRHFRYDDQSVTVSAEHELLNMSAGEYAETLNITHDGFDTLCAVWTVVDASEETTLYYATSIDNGATWDVNALSRTSTHSSYVDNITGEGCGRMDVLGGADGGFLICYTEEFAGVGKTFVRQLTTSDNGATYTLGDEHQIATHLPQNTPVVGGKFFQPMNSELMDLSDPGQVRIGYQVGESLSSGSTSYATVPVSIGQQALFNSAFPSTLVPESGSYVYDHPDSQSIGVTFSVYPGPNLNRDWYSIGFTGNFTDRYISAFNKIGNTLRFLRYEPDEDNYMNDRSAYSSPTEQYSVALFDPVTYSFPSPALNSEVTKERVEQDVRKLHVPPNLFFDRTFIVNKGGFLKRTVWIVQYGGNEYEISQVIPRFINNQICFYECNAYVVGPSRDPFSRVTLPSET